MRLYQTFTSTATVCTQLGYQTSQEYHNHGQGSKIYDLLNPKPQLQPKKTFFLNSCNRCC